MTSESLDGRAGTTAAVARAEPDPGFLQIDWGGATMARAGGVEDGEGWSGGVGVIYSTWAMFPVSDVKFDW